MIFILADFQMIFLNFLHFIYHLSELHCDLILLLIMSLLFFLIMWLVLCLIMWLLFFLILRLLLCFIMWLLILESLVYQILKFLNKDENLNSYWTFFFLCDYYIKLTEIFSFWSYFLFNYYMHFNNKSLMKS